MTNSNQPLAPNSPESEEALLGSLLINPDAILDVALFLQPPDFYIVRNGWIYEAMLTIKGRGEAVDNITVSDELKRRGLLDEAGGNAYITGLINNTPTHIHAETYARIVERASVRRKLLNAAQRIAQIAMSERDELAETINDAEAELLGVTRHIVQSNLTPIGPDAAAYYDLVEYRNSHPEDRIGCPTPFDAINEMTGGLRRGRLITIAGRPGKGKTALMLTLAGHAAEHGYKVAFESLEMSREEMLNRFVAQQTGINSRKLDGGILTDEDWAIFTAALKKVEALPLYLDDPDTIDIRTLRAEARALKRSQGLDVLFVDYLQLMLSDDTSGKTSVNQVVSAISRGLKQMARELDICVVAGCQMNRAIEGRLDGLPQLSDLRDSGSIEQDSNEVWFIHRVDDGKPQSNIIIAKNRGGPTSAMMSGQIGVSVLFDKPISLFHQGRASQPALLP